jgi:cytidylate kinase
MVQELQTEGALRSIIVTIDGPAGSGKSTTASLLAERLGLRYLDTGAMYRAVTHAVLQRGIDPENSDAVTAVARSINLDLRIEDNGPVLFLDGENIERAIRKPTVSNAVSPVSRHPGVRREMVRLQRTIASEGGIVAEGRDTGSVVFPYAHVKIFLVADLAERAERRCKQLREMGIDQQVKEIADNITARDAIDSSREHSPLVKPTGAFTVDTSTLTIEQQVSEIERLTREEAVRLAHLSVPSGERNSFEKMKIYYRISHFAVRQFFRLLFGLEIDGDVNLRYRENFIFASNHLSYFDPPVVGCALRREVSFMAKKELFANRLFAWLIRKYHAIPIDRNEIDRTTMKLIMGKLSSGESILLFPAGTRSKKEAIGTFKAGLGFLSLQSGVSIVPVYVTGTNAMRDCLVRRKRLRVRIGPPVRVRAGYRPEGGKKDYETLSSMVRSEMEMLKYEAEN